jgi:hypothetical protein
VQTVTESKYIITSVKTGAYVPLAMNVLRMIKLFGWEAKIDKRISEKREVELTWTWKTKILELVNNNLKCAFRIGLCGNNY